MRLGDDSAVGSAVGATTDQRDPTVGFPQVVGTGKQVADDAFERSSGAHEPRTSRSWDGGKVSGFRQGAVRTWQQWDNGRET